MLFTINGFDLAINLFFFLKKQLSIVLIRHRQSIYWLKEANSSFKVLPFFFWQLTCLPYSASQSFIKLILDHCLHLCDAYHFSSCFAWKVYRQDLTNKSMAVSH